MIPYICISTACTNSSIPNAGSGTATSHGKHLLKESSSVRGISEDSQGNLYFHSPDWNAKYDPTSRNDPQGGISYFKHTASSGLDNDFQEDANGLLWTPYTNGLQSFDGQIFTALPQEDFDPDRSWAMAADDLWFSTDGGKNHNEDKSQWGVYRLHQGVCTFLPFPEPPPGERSKFYPLTAHPMKGKDGTLWFGTFNAAFGFNGKTWNVIGRERMGRAQDSRYVGIRGYHMDSKGNLWMADNSAGYYVYNGTEVIHFTAMHDLEEKDDGGNSLHRAFSVAEDDNGNYWFGTVYSGIWRYTPSKEDPLRKGTFTNFDKDDGWPCEVTWRIFKTSNGELLFAGENPGGVYRFDGQVFERVF